MFNKKSNKLDLILGENSKITGDVESAGTILVRGTIIGNIKSDKVILGEKSYVKGNVFAGNISIAGKIDGCLKGMECIEIKITGHVEGDITARRLSIMEGAIFNGVSRMDDNKDHTENIDKNIIEFAAK